MEFKAVIPAPINASCTILDVKPNVFSDIYLKGLLAPCTVALR